MNTAKSTLAFLLLALAAAMPAWADHGHHGHVGVHFGVVIGPSWGPWYYPPPPYYYPPTYYPPVVIERPAPVYIEQQPAPAAAPPAPAAQNYWYYCAAAKGYYPYVKECPSGWQRVLPQPPN